MACPHSMDFPAQRERHGQFPVTVACARKGRTGGWEEQWVRCHLAQLGAGGGQREPDDIIEENYLEVRGAEVRRLRRESLGGRR